MTSSSLPELKRVDLGSQGMEVSQQGLGCMGMSSGYGPPMPEEEMIRLIRHAVDLGVTMFDTADVYGPHTNEVILGKAIKGIDREKVQIATKFGITLDENGKMGVNGTRKYVRNCVEASLKRLDVDYIDLYYYHRLDSRIPIEETIDEMWNLVEEGRVLYIGISEASSSEIRRAHKVFPLTAVQMEWSLWSRDIEEDIARTCRELGIGIVPYSPLGRGFFSGLKLADLSNDDYRKIAPRTSEENFAKNQKLFDRLVEIAKKHNKTPGQLALAWLHHQPQDDGGVVPIPGTTNIKHLEENIRAVDIKLSKEDLQEIEAAIPIADVAGDRNPEAFTDKTWPFVTTPPLTGNSWEQITRI